VPRGPVTTERDSPYQRAEGDMGVSKTPEPVAQLGLQFETVVSAKWLGASFLCPVYQ
jgi:hypothetical protein